MEDANISPAQRASWSEIGMHRVIFSILSGMLLTMIFLLFSAQQVNATEAYAKLTGQTCSACHLAPTGGGELTSAGQMFSVATHAKAEDPKANIFAKGFHLLVGYLHFLTAVFWFGTILYVHMVLKPAYAAAGLPRGEMRVGVVSMAIMGVTGTILTYYRVDTLDILVHTRFGILLLVKVSLYMVMVTSATIVITVIGPRIKAKRKEPPLVKSGDLTPEELAAFDGKEGRPAYVAVAGKIYDVTPSRHWKQGNHMARHNAGGDLTEALNLAPHGQEEVEAMREVGRLIATGSRKMELHERVFYFMAYMNLAFVLVIILILALWRWW